MKRRARRVAHVLALVGITSALVGTAAGSSALAASAGLDAVFSASTCLSGGVHQFNTLQVLAGVTLTLCPGSPGAGVLDLQVNGDVRIDGTIDLSGSPGAVGPSGDVSWIGSGGGDTAYPLSDHGTPAPGGGCATQDTITRSWGPGPLGQDGAQTSACPGKVVYGGGGGGQGGGFSGAGGGGDAGGGGGGGNTCAGNVVGGAGGGVYGGAGGGVAAGGGGGQGGGPTYDGQAGGSTVPGDCANSGYGGGGGGGSIGTDAAQDLAMATTFRAGSGGGGGAGDEGRGGGGGGGALRIRSSGVAIVTGKLLANGGRGGDSGGNPACCQGGSGGGGSGGAIWLQAPYVVNNGTVAAVGGRGGLGFASRGGGGAQNGGAGGPGRIRLSSAGPGPVNLLGGGVYQPGLAPAGTVVGTAGYAYAPGPPAPPHALAFDRVIPTQDFNTPPLTAYVTGGYALLSAGAGSHCTVTGSAAKQASGEYAETVTITPFGAGYCRVNASPGPGDYSTDPISQEFLLRPSPLAGTVQVPADLTVAATSAAGAVVTFQATALAADSSTLTPACSPASANTFVPGTTSVTCSATDPNGAGYTARFNVTVLPPPTVVVPAPVTAEATAAGGRAVSYVASATDSHGAAVTPSCDPVTGSTFPIGVTTVTCSATDPAGSKSAATFTVTIRDTTAPTVTVPDVVVEATGPAGAPASLQPTATDLVDGTLGATCTPATGSTFALGSSAVTCSATDHAGNTGSGTATVSVLDRTPPVLTLTGVTARATSSSGGPAHYTATALDLVDGAVSPSCDVPNGSTFPVGATTVTCTATDKAGNRATGTLTVTVADQAPPALTVSGATVEATGPAGAPATYRASAVDDVDGPVAPSCSPASGVVFPVGTTTITCTATDHAGNVATGTGEIRVVDTTPPSLHLVAPVTEAVDAAGAPASFVATATDRVTGHPVVTCDHTSGTRFALGTTAVTCTATDTAGNIATGTLLVTVTDTVAPTVTVRDVTVEATGPFGAPAGYAATASDAVTAVVAVSCDRPSGSTFPLGSTLVVCTALDAAGNVGRKALTVTVTDTTGPVLTLHDTTVQATRPAGAIVDLQAGATDLVSGSTPVICTPASGSVFPVGTTRVTCSSVDAAGNRSAPGTLLVTVNGRPSPPKLRLVVGSRQIEAGQQVVLLATGGADEPLALNCLSRPSTTYLAVGRARIDSYGDPVAFVLRPSSDVRCYARYTDGPGSADSPTVAIAVRPHVSLSARKLRSGTYRFQGRLSPGAAGHVVSVYRMKGARRILLGTTRTRASGIWRLDVASPPRGAVTCIATTRASASNAAGASAPYVLVVP